ncbi:MAG: hypothetical protein JO130_19755 [Solirubrobacterales bacterium]|nr:hypothetical protein [Solirubrobacterales bacterium]
MIDLLDVSQWRPYESISYEDLTDRVVSDVPAFPREVMDAFVPPVRPRGRVLKRIPNHSAKDTMMRVALGEQVHPTVRSFLDHHSHPGSWACQSGICRGQRPRSCGARRAEVS